jgi:hypothetical protein
MEARSLERSAADEPDDGDAERQPPPSVPAARIERKQLAVTQPAVLAYEKASSSSTLEDWLDSMDLLFEQLAVSDDAARLAEIRAYSDRDVRRWWEAQQQQAAADGAPIDTWEGFKRGLRAQFLPQSEKFEAISELINIRQQAGEGMDKYFLRATRLFARTNGRRKEGTLPPRAPCVSYESSLSCCVDLPRTARLVSSPIRARR